MEELFALVHVDGGGRADETVTPVAGLAPRPLDEAEAMRRVHAVASAADTDSTDVLIGALEQVRQLESWLEARRHAIAVSATHAATRDHEAWVSANPTWDDGLADRGSAGLGHGGLTRAERVAVAERSAIAEIACALRIGEKAAHLLIQHGQLLDAWLPDTTTALAAGTITGAAARIIIDSAREYTSLPVTDAQTDARVRTAVEQTERFLLDVACAGGTTGEVGARARRLRERLHPLSRQERHEVARADRCVRVRPGCDGMAHLTAWLPAADAHDVDHHLTALARAALGPQLEVSTGRTRETGMPDDEDERTVGQARVDVLTDLIIGGTTSGSVPDAAGTTAPDLSDAGAGGTRAAPSADGPSSSPPSLLLTMPAAVLLGEDGPAAFGPFGSIPVEDARRLASTATSFTLGITLADDSSPTGTRLITAGRQYRIPAELRRRLQVRDGTCRFPGCRRAATRCDLDHRTAWADGGATEEDNLAHLCRRHHVLKHHSAWRVTGPPGLDAASRDDPTPTSSASSSSVPAPAPYSSPPPASSVLHWVSPTGRRYRSDPDDAPFRRPPAPPAR
ncbi:HNH endonuclease signature motif containing protein [Tersicoccus sp. Bi-70]|uniref:HNH endonuclease signature motif containing protein n=1 Tax=Tersicoccus sp. Bi-70 TaxID=1897634 RepID=UPI00097705DD|nr:HNH endonuclease signature motif containing protein [Tersicoccus sp. Bi-70]OMH34873.1 hypothetical protein BGP79_00430 [Tersicoccus sp. Bi-70]